MTDYDETWRVIHNGGRESFVTVRFNRTLRQFQARLDLASVDVGVETNRDNNDTVHLVRGSIMRWIFENLRVEKIETA
jgi:hypothetical protein